MKRMIITLGIFHIIYGILSLVYLGFFLVIFCVPQSPEQNPMLNIINRSLSLQLWYIGISGIDFIASLVVIITGVGLLMMAHWAKIFSIGYVMYNILSNITRCTISFIFIILPLWQEWINTKTDEMIGGAVIITALTLVSLIINIIYELFIIIVITSPDTAKAFRK